jgi:hypothetical protein
MRGHKDLTNTGERREITARVNAEEAEPVQRSKKLSVESKAALRKRGREVLGAKRQSTEGPISSRYSVMPGFDGRSRNLPSSGEDGVG